ncbi:MAG: hypothetical protein V1490_02020 [Candidatus Omnitrophota bacterium]
MSLTKIITLIIIGLSGITAQVLILRELLVGFYGNELSLGIILANWVLLEACGAFVLGKFADRIKNQLGFFIFLQIIFVLFLPVAIYLARIYKGVLGISFAQGLGLGHIFIVSLAISLPIAFIHGGLFSSTCRLFQEAQKRSYCVIGKVYAWEAVGTFLGGICLTYLFIPYLNSFRVVYLIAMTNIIFSFILIKNWPGLKKNYLFSLALILILILFLIVNPDRIHKGSINRQWQTTQMLEYRNSVYENIVVLKNKEQYSFYRNAIPSLTMPWTDLVYAEEFGNFPLLFHHDPKDVLLINSGTGGLLKEILFGGLKRLDYLEVDPLFIALVKKYASRVTLQEFSDSRVKVINQDARFYMGNKSLFYDCILLGETIPASLSANRFFTKEFFMQVSRRLKAAGIFAFTLPGSLTHLSPELRDVNYSVFNALNKVFRFTRILPGDYNIYLASNSVDLDKIGAELIIRRFKERKTGSSFLSAGHIEYRLSPGLRQWFYDNSRGATARVNSDTMPVLVWQMLAFWNNKFSPSISGVLKFLGNLNVGQLIIGLFILFLILFKLSYKRRSVKFSVSYTIFTTGFLGVILSLGLLLNFQIVYGYLYHQIGLLIGLFMLGAGLGSLANSSFLLRIKDSLKLLMGIEVLGVLFALSLALSASSLQANLLVMYLFFYPAFVISGFIVGLEFPLAAKIYLQYGHKPAETSGLLYFFDLLGSSLGSVLSCVLFIPLIGLFNTYLVAVILKLTSIFMFYLYTRKGAKIL